MSITSHTIVKNSMPFIGEVLRRALPHVERMLVTISVNADEETIEAVFALRSPKIEVTWEDVSHFSQLTAERQKQADKTTSEWIWFLDDDDLYPDEVIESVKRHMDEDVDAISLNPWQVLSETHHDKNWYGTKWFSKFFRNKDINYRGDFPRDLIYSGDTSLYWKDNERVLRLQYRDPENKFFHMAKVKQKSFREDHEYHQDKSVLPRELPEESQSWLKDEGIFGLR